METIITNKCSILKLKEWNCWKWCASNMKGCRPLMVRLTVRDPLKTPMQRSFTSMVLSVLFLFFFTYLLYLPTCLPIYPSLFILYLSIYLSPLLSNSFSLKEQFYEKSSWKVTRFLFSWLKIAWFFDENVKSAPFLRVASFLFRCVLIFLRVTLVLF